MLIKKYPGHKKKLFSPKRYTLCQLPIHTFLFQTGSNIFLLVSHVFSFLKNLENLENFVADGQGKNKEHKKKQKDGGPVNPTLLWKCFFLWSNEICWPCFPYVTLDSPLSWKMTKILYISSLGQLLETENQLMNDYYWEFTVTPVGNLTAMYT